MARITVEDCLQRVANRFELIMLATKRARDLMRGKSDTQLEWENDKATVLALREIAEGNVSVDYLKQTNEPQEHDLVAVMGDVPANAADQTDEQTPPAI